MNRPNGEMYDHPTRKLELFHEYFTRLYTSLDCLTEKAKSIVLCSLQATAPSITKVLRNSKSKILPRDLFRCFENIMKLSCGLLVEKPYDYCPVHAIQHHFLKVKIGVWLCLRPLHISCFYFIESIPCIDKKHENTI